MIKRVATALSFCSSVLRSQDIVMATANSFRDGAYTFAPGY
jgi:hypothetical protein